MYNIYVKEFECTLYKFIKIIIKKSITLLWCVPYYLKKKTNCKYFSDLPNVIGRNMVGVYSQNFVRETGFIKKYLSVIFNGSSFC